MHLLLELRVADARRVLKRLAVDYLDVAAPVVYDAQLLQPAHALVDARATHSQLPRRRLLRHRQVVSSGAVVQHQKPSAEPLAQTVSRVADGAARDLIDERRVVAQQMLLPDGAVVKALAQQPRFNSVEDVVPRNDGVR